MNPKMRLNLVWWNVGVSPAISKKRERKANEHSLWSDFLALLKSVHEIDLFALCEVSSGDVMLLKKDDRFSEFEIFDLTEKSGKSRFDICLLAKKSKLRMDFHRQEQVITLGRNLKLGQHVIFSAFGCEEPLHFFFSHWPSRLHCHENSAQRHLLGLRLREFFDRIYSEDEDLFCVFAGDYNDEPFDKSLAEQLMATRDRLMAAQKKQLLYNPFWRIMTNSHFSYNSGVPFGTYFHRSGSSTKWRTFDQIIFSSSFLRDGAWALEDDSVSIIDYPPYVDMILDKKYNFDHLPIVSSVSRRK